MRFPTVLLAVALLLPTQIVAQSRQVPVVVEMFTSQGCSSCPPADSLVRDLSTRSDVLPLSLHVDYWDYLGWKDVFGSSDNTQRQRAYIASIGGRTIYTPQAVVQGQAGIVGSHGRDLETLITKFRDGGTKAQIGARRAGDTVEITIAPMQANLPRSEVHFVQYEPRAQVNILRGENAGRTLTYANVVRNWSTLRDWDGRSAVSFKAGYGKNLPVAIIVQARGNGPILGAATLR
ncbi:DUF1223 domain-containing protein [Oceanomicrobium pacificus]|uniref:DUF1223 domain-containing protein n=1 Tax=Oceanomicrobium pacificus TaxID=2692916 RepID=A0A6B0TNV9_9RHOB|nr:DUF1223 domain-containing protein [Oceanomicrobium pacificus]MXU65556.1 DUF1223 domain-containing protein [Oceanomicrobium pacificus]